MSEVLGCISLFVSCILLLAVLIIYRKMKFFIESPTEAIDFNDITSSFNEWIGDDTNRDSLIKNAENLLAAPIAKKLYESIRGALGGTTKGINSSMKSLAKEVTSDAIDMVAPGWGDLGSKYLGKYPELKALLPILLNRAGEAGGGGGFLPNLGSPASPAPATDPKRLGYNL